MALHEVRLTSTSKTARWLWALAYVAFVLAVAGLFEASLNLVRVRGGFTYPPGFQLFRALFYVQFGLFGGLLVSALLYLLHRERVSLIVRALIFFAFHFWACWLFVWGLVQRSYGVILTGDVVFELFTNPVAATAMGLETREFVWIATCSLSLVAALTAVSLALGPRVEPRLRRTVLFCAIALFLVFHIPVRAYFVHNINRDNHVVLVYDDCAPFPLRSERLIPGLRRDRFTLPNLKDDNRSKKYFDFMGNRQMPSIPLRRNILWIVIESLRFDAIEERVMPRLLAHRDRFQIRLNRHHWSSGNATQFGNFSMLTGLSGYHYPFVLRKRMSDPFLSLLAKNGYKLRVGNKDYYQFGRLFSLFPPETLLINTGADSIIKKDRRMVDLYLEDRAARDRGIPALDLLPLDSTHWPYRYPRAHAIFQPALLAGSSTHTLRSGSDLESVRNRNRNACHFLDEQIGRVLDDLATSGGFDNTIVILVGDHGEEFQERGQITHSAVLNDYQARTVLWMHFPDRAPGSINIEVPTVHLDIVPTLLQALGFGEDALYTQGRSLLGRLEDRPALALCEQGFSVPLYRSLVTDTYISRWWHTPSRYLFSGVQRRDGRNVEGDDWWREAQELHAGASEMYEILPDVSQPTRQFDSPDPPLSAGR